MSTPKRKRYSPEYKHELVERVRQLGQNVDWGVGDDMNALLAGHGLDDQQR